MSDTSESTMCDTNNSNIVEEQLPDVTTSIEDIKELLTFFSTYTYQAHSEPEPAKIHLKRCMKLLEEDYSIIVVGNSSGELSANYPSQLPVLEYEKASNSNQNLTTSQSSARSTNTIYESNYDAQKFRDIFHRAKFARCRARFPMPVILYKSKYICRSATLSGGAEIYGRSGLDFLFYGGGGVETAVDSGNVENPESALSLTTLPSLGDWQLCDKVRNQDIKLLKKLNIGTIFDFMVEKKKVKYGLNVSSSEKVDKANRYSDFNIISLPYPGCEFFKDFRDNNFNAEGLLFDWTKSQCNATINVPDNPHLAYLKIEWDNYKSWDLITMTQNYIKYMLKYFQDNSSGILVHCISGWDRTPLYISMIRLSLWADGLIHQSLDDVQILYLTLAYDWLLFGHNLPDRMDKGEEIMFFCFYMLKHLTSSEYSSAPRYKMKKVTDKMFEDSVNKLDTEPHMDLLFDQSDYRGSNVSLSSISSTVSSKSQEPTAWGHHVDEPNGNSLDIRDNLALGASASPQAKRTSPVTVPSCAARSKRTESTGTTCSTLSSNSTHSNSNSSSGSGWQVVTNTGSLRGSDSGGDIPFSHSSLNTVIDGDDYADPTIQAPNRKDRLLRVRENFYKCYFSSIGCKNVRFGPDSGLGAIFGNIAERVGFAQRT